MSQLGVVGNISIDRTRRRGLLGPASIGGTALYVALAAARAGLTSRPLSVVGPDMEMIRHGTLRDVLDLSGVKTIPGKSAVFTLSYDVDEVLVGVDADYGVSAQLTAHALEQIHARSDRFYHVCCRRPLDVTRVLDALVQARMRFSLDFFVPSAAESISAATNALPMAHMVFANAAEYALLTEAVPTRTLRGVLVTDGPRPAQLIRSGRSLAQATPPHVTTVDVTGAGDTVAGTFLAARAAGLRDAVWRSATPPHSESLLSCSPRTSRPTAPRSTVPHCIFPTSSSKLW